MYVYPYGDSQQLNLDWIINKLKELENQSAPDLEEIANVFIALTHSSGTQYRRYDYCYYQGKLYRALNDNIGAFNASDWMEVRLGDDIPVLTRLINAIDAAAVVDVKFDTSGTNGKLQQKYNNAYHDVVEVDYTPVQNSKRPLSSNAGYELNSAITQKADISLFKRIGIIGDSYACGEQYYGGSHHDLPTLSWGAMLAREAGISAEIYAKGGQSVASFLDSTDPNYNTTGYGKVIIDKNDAYGNVGLFIIALGLNDAYSDPSGANVSTFSSNLSTIIDNINTLYSNSVRIILLTFKRLRTTIASDTAYNTAIINTATAKNVPVIDIRELDYFKSEAYTENYDSSSHPNVENYAGMAHALKNAIENTICGNTYFTGYRNLNVWNDMDVLLNSIKKSQSTEQKQVHTVNVPNSSAHLLLIYGGGAVTYGVLFVTATSGGVTGAVQISIGTGAAAPVIAENTGNITVTYNSNRNLYMYDFLVYGDFCYIT